MTKKVQHPPATTGPNFPMFVSEVILSCIDLPEDIYAVHVLPLMLDRIKAGENVPVIAVRRESDKFSSMLLVRELDLPARNLSSMKPQFMNPLPGSTTVVWLQTRGTLRVWFEAGKMPNWIAIAGRSKPDVLADIMAEVNR